MSLMGRILQALAKAEGLEAMDLLININLDKKRPTSLCTLSDCLSLAIVEHKYVVMLGDLYIPTHQGLSALSLVEAKIA